MRTLLAVVVGVTVVVALSIVVGFVGSPDTDFGWELAAVVGTALGTTLLGAATLWLAFSTHADVRATQRLAEVAREDQIARDRPIVVHLATGVDPEDVYPQTRDVTLTIELRNVGLGPALNVRIHAKQKGGGLHSGPDVAVIAPGETARQEMKFGMFEGQRAARLRPNDFEISGSYADRFRNREPDYVIVSAASLEAIPPPALEPTRPG